MRKKEEKATAKRLYEGRWWVPGSEDTKFIGELWLDPKEGLQLHLKIPEGYAKTAKNPVKVIHGHDEHGKPITLFHTHWRNENGSGALTTFIYHAGYCFHGAHFDRWADAQFDEVLAEFTNLNDWMNTSGFLSATAPQYEARIHYRIPDDVEFDSGQGFLLKLAVEVSQYSEFGLSSIREKWRLKLKYENVQTFKRLRQGSRT